MAAGSRAFVSRVAIPARTRLCASLASFVLYCLPPPRPFAGRTATVAATSSLLLSSVDRSITLRRALSRPASQAPYPLLNVLYYHHVARLQHYHTIDSGIPLAQEARLPLNLCKFSAYHDQLTPFKLVFCLSQTLEVYPQHETLRHFSCPALRKLEYILHALKYAR